MRPFISVVVVLALTGCSGPTEPAADASPTDGSVRDGSARDAGDGAVQDGASTADGAGFDATPTDGEAADGNRGDGAAEPDAGLVGCEGLDLETYRSADCFCADACDCFLGIPYGPATWTEGGDRAQLVDVFVPRGSTTPSPLVVWAHANNATREVRARSPLAQQVALPLLEEGTAFASVEFRHPFVNAEDDAPRTDIADAIQFLRCHSATLGTSRERMAAIARSRGTLAIWTALQNDLALPGDPSPARRESTRLRGVFGIQAQTSYWGDWIASTFFSEASRLIILGMITSEDFGHAVGDVTSDDPPVAMIYQGPLETLPLEASECLPSGAVDCRHLPNFADELCAAYAAVGIGERCSATYSTDAADLYSPALLSLRTWLAP